MPWTPSENVPVNPATAPVPEPPKFLTIISGNQKYTYEVKPDSSLDQVIDPKTGAVIDPGIFGSVITKANSDPSGPLYRRIQKAEFFDEQGEMITPSNLPQKGSFGGRTFTMKVSQHTSAWTAR